MPPASRLIAALEGPLAAVNATSEYGSKGLEQMISACRSAKADDWKSLASAANLLERQMSELGSNSADTVVSVAVTTLDDLERYYVKTQKPTKALEQARGKFQIAGRLYRLAFGELAAGFKYIGAHDCDVSRNQQDAAERTTRAHERVKEALELIRQAGFKVDLKWATAPG